MIQRLILGFGILSIASCGESRFDLSQMGKDLNGISYSVSPDAKSEIEIHLSGEKPDVLKVNLEKDSKDPGAVNFSMGGSSLTLTVATNRGTAKKLETTEEPILGFFSASPDALAVLGMRAFEEANQMKPIVAYQTELSSKRTETATKDGESNTIHSYSVTAQVLMATSLVNPKHALITELRRPDLPVQLHIVAKQTPIIQTDKNGVLRVILEYASPTKGNSETSNNSEPTKVVPANQGSSVENQPTSESAAHPILDQIEL